MLKSAFCAVALAVVPIAGSAVTVVESDTADEYLEMFLPNYLLGGQLRIEATNDWQTVTIGLSVADNRSRMSDLYYDAPRRQAEVFQGELGQPWMSFPRTDADIGLLGRSDSSDRYIFRFTDNQPGGLFGDTGFRLNLSQLYFGNEYTKNVDIVVTDRDETSLNLLIWDHAGVDVAPAPIPLPPAGLLMLTCLGLLTLRRNA